MKVEEKLYLDRYKVDTVPHIKIIDPKKCLICENKQCTVVCPAGVYKWDDGEKRVIVGWENCLEMGACLVACDEFENIDWHYPRGGYGIIYKYG